MGFAWPKFLSTLASGTTITITGTPSYKDSWSTANGCPTGGIVTTAITVGSSASPAPAPSPSVVPVTAPGLKIIASSVGTGNWLADRDYVGGVQWSTTAAIDVTHVTNAAPQAVYQTQRYGTNVQYTFAGLAPQAAYAIRLHFAETYWSSTGQRVFNATINGSQVLTNFDIFAAAGGKNIAIAKQYATVADASGKITLALSAIKDNAFISGIEVTPGTAAPTPAPTATPVPAATATPVPVTTPGTTYPIYSSLFTAANNPFHMSVSSLVARGAQRQSQTLMNNLWSQGYYLEDSLDYPLYESKAGNPTVAVHCTFWGNCNPNGYNVHLPSGAKPEAKGDHHIIVVDQAQGLEFDGWGGASAYGGGSCAVSSAIDCSWGGFYPLSGKGLSDTGLEGNHGGAAIGLFTITAQEVLQGHIDHALGINAECLDNPSVYPADTHNGTDLSCSGGSGASPAPGYGMMVHLVSSFNIASSAYSPACKTILTAMQTYGAYLYDTGNQGLFVSTEDPQVYTGTNPWYSQIYPQMAAYGDAAGSGSSWGTYSCFNHLHASDLEIYTIPNLGY